MGVPGTLVRVTVKRAEAPEGEFEEIVVTRRAISVRTLRGVHRDGPAWDYWIDRESGLAYFRVSQFTQPTPGEIHKAVTQLLGQGLKGLVLDLRFNPGGSLQSAVQVSDLFLDEGVIVSVRGRSGDTAFTARSPGTLPDFPMVVLLNGHSASASEIVAGALQEADRAVVLGTRSFGKGHVQDVRPLPSGAGHLKMTTANYYLPSGRNIHKSPDSTTWGVDPNPGFFIPLTTAQYNQILRIQRELDIIRDGNDEGEWHDPRWVRERLDDLQLAGAVEALRHFLAHGEWNRPGGDLEENEPILDELRVVERTRERLLRQLEQVDERLEQLLAFVPVEKKEEPVRLIPEDRELAGGLIEVKDADGQIITVLRVTDPTLLEAGLRHAELKPLEEGVTEN
jgi:carboxyl-terminal processing protease